MTLLVYDVDLPWFIVLLMYEEDNKPNIDKSQFIAQTITQLINNRFFFLDKRKYSNKLRGHSLDEIFLSLNKKFIINCDLYKVKSYFPSINGPKKNLMK